MNREKKKTWLSELFTENKKLIIWVGIGILFFAIAIPLFTHIAFSSPANSQYWTAKWSAGDLLGFFVSLLTFASTVLLSLIVLWQNNQLHLKAIEMETANKERRISDIKPDVFISKSNFTDAITMHGVNQFLELNLTVKNLNNRLAKNVSVSNFSLFGEPLTSTYQFVGQAESLANTSECFHSSKVHHVILEKSTSMEITIVYSDVDDNQYTRIYRSTKVINENNWSPFVLLEELFNGLSVDISRNV